METHEIVIVGAGSAGLATAALLRQRGLAPVVLEAGPEPGAAWRERYDRLRLHTPRLLSGLPGMRIPRRFGRWVARDDLIEYLRALRGRHDLDVRTGTRVSASTATETAGGSRPTHGPMRRATVVVATGYNGAPFVPDWPGRDGVRGRAAPLVAVPEPGAVPRPRRARRRRRELRRGDRARRRSTAARRGRGSRCARRRRSCAARRRAFRRS